MPAKPSAKKSTKSNVASSSKLISKRRYDWRIIAVIVVMLAAGLGYLWIRFSKAAAYTWTGSQIGINKYSSSGQRVTKSDGRVAVQSVDLGNGRQNMTIYVNSKVSAYDVYCFTGNATQPLSYYSVHTVRGDDYYGYNTSSIHLGYNSTSTQVGPYIPAGNFKLCAGIPNTDSYALGDKQRWVELRAQSTGVFAVYTVERQGGSTSSGSK